jgi:2-(1,2-epoxy-1,2-dihydrophenyl)acetyl-CoA isomerase
VTRFETLRYEVDGGLARLTLDRPDAMNGMTNRMVREARDALELAASDSSVRVLVLTGEGRAFCPGADLKHFAAGGDDERLTAREFQVTTLLHEIPAVTVAAVNGACAGAGLGWALACDLRVIAASAKLNTAFLDVAVARKVDADEALRIGLVARVFGDDSFRRDVDDLLGALLKKSPSALLGLKENYVAAERMTLRDFVDYEAERHLRIAAGADTAEAFRAFVEKREPDFG